MWYSSAFNQNAKIDGDGSIFVAAWLPDDIYKKLKHIDDVDKDLHMTFLYLEKGFEDKKTRIKALECIEDQCRKYQPMSCQLTEIGIMGNEENSLVMNVTVQKGADFYFHLVNSIQACCNDYQPLDMKYDFLPHVTIRYENDENIINIKDLRKYKWVVDEISVQFGSDLKKYKFKLGE